jgi:hypothetical protein
MNNKFQPRSDRRNNSVENFNLNRGMDISLKNEKNLDVLNDRDMFFRFSNGNEQIDMSIFKPNDNFGMPLFNPQIMNNKKNLINNPYIQESNDQTHFRALNTMSNLSSNMYANFGDDDNASNNSEGGGYTMGKFSGFDKINTENKTKSISKEGLMENGLLNSNDPIEKGIIVYEYTTNLNKEKNFLMDIISPFALSYLWKSLILLSKNPSTDKILKMLQVKKKEEIVNDMKYYSDIFKDMGNLCYMIPYSNGMINTNFTSKIKDIYKIEVESIDKTNRFDNNPIENAMINLKLKFELKIPYYYQPSLIIDYLLDFNANKIKYLKMLNVPCALDIDRQTDTVNLEIPVGDEMILGFIYNLSRKNVTNSDLLYNKINQKRPINTLVKELYIPKINRNKKINYGKKFANDLKQIHLGEIIYGNMYDIDITTDIDLEITIDKNVSNKKYQIITNIDEIKINHRCYFYIKNLNIENRVLISGMIEY